MLRSRSELFMRPFGRQARANRSSAFAEWRNSSAVRQQATGEVCSTSLRDEGTTTAFEHVSNTASRSRDACCARGLPRISLPSLIRGRRECRAPDAPAAARAVVESTRVSHHGHTGNTRHSPRNGFNGFLRALPGDRAFLPPSPREACFHELDASVGASGPHDFAVRQQHRSSSALPRPPHPAPRP